MATQVQPFVTTAEALPTATPAAGTPGARGTYYGDAFAYEVGSKRQNLAGEATYWSCTAAAPGTTVAYGSGGTQATFSTTTAFVVVKNNNPAGSTKRTFLDAIKIFCQGTMPASATSVRCAVKTDTGNRAPTAGASAATNATFVNSQAPSTANTQCWFPNSAVPTVPAEVSARLIGWGVLRSVIPVTLDELVIKFGADDGIGIGPSGAVGRYGDSLPPVVLNATEFAIVHLWLPSGATNPLPVEIEVTGWER